MKMSVFIDEEQLVAKAVEILINELGPVEASRFLSLPIPHKLSKI